MSDLVTRIAVCKCGFERVLPAPEGWTEQEILVLPLSPAEPFLPECVECKQSTHGGMEIMQDDDGVFHRVKTCSIRFRAVGQEAIH